jgi:saccharopine dehydrogenase-like NADP-dependent oxidoreductase
LSRPGVWAPEQVIDPEPFFAELAQRGFTTRVSKQQTVAAP